MGRKSKLTDKQWSEIDRRLIAGESARSLAKEFGIAESTIRERFSDAHKKIKTVANQIVETEQALRALPVSAQISAHNLASELIAISTHLSSAAKLGAMTAHRLAGIANNQVQYVDDAEPEKSTEALQRIAVLSKIANTSAEIGVNILRANKEMIDTMNRPQDQNTDDDTRANSIAARLESNIAGSATR